jgi:hypothetical protein
MMRDIVSCFDRISIGPEILKQKKLKKKKKKKKSIRRDNN